MGLMSSNGGWDTAFRLFVGLPRTREDPALRQASNRFQAATTVSSKFEEWSKAVCEFLGAVQLFHDLLERHGGESQLLYVLALGHVEQTPDAALEARLRGLMQQYGDELELQQMWRLLDRDKKRVRSTGPPARVENIRTGFKQYGSYATALNALANYYLDNETEILKDAIRDEVCSEGAWVLPNKDIMNRVGSRIRREATKAREGSFAAPLLLPDDQVSEDRGRVDLLAFDAAAHLQQLLNRADLSAQEEESFLILGRMTSKQAAKELGRSPEQIRQEKLRAVLKLRAAAH